MGDCRARCKRELGLSGLTGAAMREVQRNRLQEAGLQAAKGLQTHRCSEIRMALLQKRDIKKISLNKTSFKD